MLKFHGIVCVLVVLCISWVVCEEGKGYETKYDNVDLDEILKNDRLRKNYIRCLLNEGPCTPDAQELKTSLPDAIATNCSKCTEKQRTGSEKVTHYLIDNQPTEWDQLAAVYDKGGEYKQNYIESKMRDKEAGETTITTDGENNEVNEENKNQNKQD